MTTPRLRDQRITFASGVTGRTLEVPSASPRNYHEALAAAAWMPLLLVVDDGGAATLRLFAGAAHSFDRGTPIVRIAEAAVAPGAPTAYLAADGAFIHPVTGQADPGLTDRDVAIYGLKAGYGVRAATPGSRDGEAAAFRHEMLAFWTAALG